MAGNCVDMPNEPAESNFKHKVKATAYPCQERGGVVWAYLGPRETPPPLPDLEPNMLPDGQWQVTAALRNCNWLQGLEGDIDTSHLGFLHFGSRDPEATAFDTFDYWTVKDRAPRYQVVDTDFGTMYGAYRPAGEEKDYWRFANFLFPCYAMIPTFVLGLQVLVRAWVPVDDEHIMFYSMACTTNQPPNNPARGQAPRMELLPNETGWLGRHRLAQNAGNDYWIDRDKQRRGEDFTGIPGIPPAGPGRHREHGRHLRPLQRTPRQQRRDGHPRPAASPGGGAAAQRGRRNPARRGPSRGLSRPLRRRFPSEGSRLAGSDQGLTGGLRGASGAGPGNQRGQGLES